MKFNKTATTYRIDVTTKEMLAVIKAEPPTVDNTLGEILEKIDGVSSVEYGGHFGPSFYFCIDHGKDTKATKDLISQTITGHIQSIYRKRKKKNEFRNFR